jgi:hypothetical protein
MVVVPLILICIKLLLNCCVGGFYDGRFGIPPVVWDTQDGFQMIIWSKRMIKDIENP